MSHDATPQEPHVPLLWSNQRISEAYRKSFNDRMLMRQMRDDYEREVSRLRAELAERGQWEPVPAGQYHDGINTWQVGWGMVGVKPWLQPGMLYAGTLPDGWQLMRPRDATGEEATP